MPRRTFILSAAYFLCFSSGWAALKLEVSPESQIWLEGNSTFHAYSSTATQFQAQVNLSAKSENVQSFLDAVQSRAVQSFELSIPVAGLKSDKSGLDKNMAKSLLAQDFPGISFQMKEYALTSLKDKETFEIKAVGTLSVAGQPREITLNAVGKTLAGGAEVTGTQELLMTDFEIKPPTMFMGALKTNNKVAVHYRLRFKLTDTK